MASIHGPGLIPAGEEQPAWGGAVSISMSWPAIAAIATALVYICGYAYFRAVNRTLGLDSLSVSIAKEEHLVRGVVLILQLTLFGFMGLAILAMPVYLFRLLPERFRNSVANRQGKLLLTSARTVRPVVVVLLAATGLVFGGFISTNLVQFDRLPLQDAPPHTIISPEDLFSDQGAGATGELLLVGWATWIWAIASTLAWRGLGRSRLKAIYVFISGIIALELLINWASLAGVVSTVSDYPVVGGPDLEQTIGRPALCLRLGADDKELAVLVIVPGSGGDWKNAKKFILYLPRSTARWWLTNTKRPLYRYAFIGWYPSKSQSPKLY